MPDFVFLKIKFYEVASEIDCNGSIGFPSWQTLFENVCYESYPATKRAVVAVESLGRNGVIVQDILFELDKGESTFLSLAKVS